MKQGGQKNEIWILTWGILKDLIDCNKAKEGLRTTPCLFFIEKLSFCIAAVYILHISESVYQNG